MTAVSWPGLAVKPTCSRTGRPPISTLTSKASIMASPGNRIAAAQQYPEEEGPAHRRCDDADRQFGRSDDEAADGIGHQQEGGAKQRRGGQQVAVIGSDNEAQEM